MSEKTVFACDKYPSKEIVIRPATFKNERHNVMDRKAVAFRPTFTKRVVHQDKYLKRVVVGTLTTDDPEVIENLKRHQDFIDRPEGHLEKFLGRAIYVLDVIPNNDLSKPNKMVRGVAIAPLRKEVEVLSEAPAKEKAVEPEAVKTPKRRSLAEVK